ncbi:M12 family metallopeptidase [Mucilaginibacter sp. NFX135]|uniref:M12 family metallopeptidase n=1 Tax=Mucilaginibacter sp. NFX135 TaxID=3402687 RepID=UPI003AFA7A3C
MLYAQGWSQYCSITFSVTNDVRAAKLRVGFQNTGSWSHIGTNAKGIPRSRATINFGWLSNTLPERDFKQVVLHEFGHALGLIHEHQSQRRWAMEQAVCL